MVTKAYRAKKAEERRNHRRSVEQCSDCEQPVLKKVIFHQLKVFARCKQCLKRMSIAQEIYRHR